MSAQVGVAFKVSEGGLRNAAVHPGSCVTFSELRPETEREREKSFNPLEVQIGRTALFAVFPFKDQI